MRVPTCAALLALAVAHDASLSLAYANPTCSKWLCLMGINTPLRVNEAGNIECQSTNHHDCAWQSSHEGCVAAKASPTDASIQPLVCGTAHLKEGWGVTGYDTPTHWCNKAYRTLVQKTPPLPPTWTCLPGINTPLRIGPTSGEVECMSANHHDCHWQGSAEDCQILADTNPPSGVDPLICGAFHNKEWGVPGYGDPNHWCDKAKGASPLPGYKPWECIPGVYAPVRRTPSGDVQCLSTNHQDCLVQASDAACKTYVAQLNGGSSSGSGGVSPACKCTPNVGFCPAAGDCLYCNTDMGNGVKSCQAQWSKQDCDAQRNPAKFLWCGAGGAYGNALPTSPPPTWGQIDPAACSALPATTPWCKTAKAYYGSAKLSASIESPPALEMAVSLTSYPEKLWSMALQAIYGLAETGLTPETTAMAAAAAGILVAAIALMAVRAVPRMIASQAKEDHVHDGYISLIG
ncbi:Aste57867_416 [Aphanomyces stellatus]|uniref:Aste57867_416 protein n=1 Tax=Aphanomyces stellatus TaxID=120398 RepID=A0A485K584_9STRA|nr:hypothetical protein As57867_000415 [Aphanomyces stellatus]VFT77641.1 Aste57867_416 [Aphanomyces stellatus]